MKKDHYEIFDVVCHPGNESMGVVVEVSPNGEASVQWFLNASEGVVAWWPVGKLEIVDNLTYLIGRGFNYHGCSSAHLKSKFGKRFRSDRLP